MKRILLSLLAATPLPAIAQQAIPVRPVLPRPTTEVSALPERPRVDATQLQLEVMRLDIAKLKADLATAQKALANTTAQLSFASSLLTSLNARFLTHYHRVNGDVGSGFSSGYDGDQIYISYMLPIKSSSAQYHARETSGPLP